METTNLVSLKPKLAVGDEQACIVAWNKAMEADNAAKVPQWCEKYRPKVKDGQCKLFGGANE